MRALARHWLVWCAEGLERQAESWGWRACVLLSALLILCVARSEAAAPHCAPFALAFQDGDTPLWIAAQNGHDAVLTLLAAKGMTTAPIAVIECVAFNVCQTYESVCAW